MCYARRQRSSWARIKLSEKWYISNGGLSLDHSKYQFQSFNLCLLFYLIYLLFVFKRIVEISFKLVSFRLHQVPSMFPHCTFLSISCCSIFKDHSCQALSACSVTHTRLIYYIISWSVCQEVLQKFFGIFFFCSFLSFGLLRLFGRFWLTLILYHIFNRLSRGFQKFFYFFQPPARRLSLADSLFSIPHLARFVKRFSWFFLDLWHVCI